MKSLKVLTVVSALMLTSFVVDTVTADVPLNGLSEAEKRSGWKVLFDGESTDGWRNYKKESVSDGWQIKDGALIRAGGGAGDIITTGQYKHFELFLEYNISKGGNSGIMFHVTEEYNAPWQTGPEIQVQDNVDGHDPQKSGWLYQLYKPKKPAWATMFEEQVGFKGKEMDDATRPPGEWNLVYLRIGPKNCEVQINGVHYYYFKVGSPEWNGLVAKSKFSKYPNFGKMGEGHICLQDHGNLVSYRNIKIREIKDGEVPSISDKEITLNAVEAFPGMTWEDFEGVDEDGKIQVMRPVELVHPGDGSNRLFALDQRGRIYSIDATGKEKEAKVVVDFQDRVQAHDAAGNVNEEGALGMAIHPDYENNGQIFVYYSSNKSNLKDGRVSYLSRFTVDLKSGVGKAANEKMIMTIPQPFSNHNGGPMTFGNDGLLYIGMGDGGGRNDPTGQGQDLSSWMGSILRIDVDHPTETRPYSIPKDNPFVDMEGAQPEIYAYGIRNPWRIANDPKTGTIWIGDVGQDQWEEINILKKGANYGWSAREGSYQFGNAPVDPELEVTDPIFEYDHQIGKSITGGYVYRGKEFPELQGAYLYADYISGRIWALKYNVKKEHVISNIEIKSSGTPVMAFGLGEDGEIYYTVGAASGRCIYKFARP